MAGACGLGVLRLAQGSRVVESGPGRYAGTARRSAMYQYLGPFAVVQGVGAADLDLAMRVIELPGAGAHEEPRRR